MPTRPRKSRSALRSPTDFDRQDTHAGEYEYFQSFRHFEPDIQSGLVTHTDIPDFRVQVGNRIIGVEVRRLFTPLSSPAIESTQDSILELACSKAERLNLPTAGVVLFFNLRGPLRVADRNRVADAVVQVVADNMPADGDIVRIEQRPDQPSEVDLILIDRQLRREVSRWRADFEFHAIDRTISDIIQKAINGKADRLPTYRNACDECWLLLVADSFEASGNLKFGEVGQPHSFSSPFTRTYVLDFGGGHLYQLNESGCFTMTASIHNFAL